MIDYERLFRELDAYVGCAWDQDELTLKNGAVYSRHITYTGTVEGKTVTAQLWCQRKSHGCMDILTVDQKIIGFINPGRICSEITVLAGYESVTPLTRFDDPLLSKVAYGVNPLGNIMVPCKDGVVLQRRSSCPRDWSLARRFRLLSSEPAMARPAILTAAGTGSRAAMRS